MSNAKFWMTVAESQYPWERDALDFIRQRFRDHEPYRAWTNFEFLADDGSTRHDISHVDGMLQMLEWLVPESTKRIMSPADWAMSVLAVYFHDLGMLVTKDEYSRREASGFPEFREKVLFAGEAGVDFRDRIKNLGADEAQRFLYQEYVRHNHGERVRCWVTGQANASLGIATAIVGEVDRLLGALDSLIRRDLGLICESHNLDDLEDVKKYKVSQPYGDSEAETANLQYVAMLLRTADLLHITQARTPAEVFRLISPMHPTSHKEWIKQQAVRRVHSRIGVDAEGNPSDKAPRNTIEIHAYFKEPDGFFGLTSYLRYAEKQLRKTYEICQTSMKRSGTRHEFPWRHIDDSGIETQGFLRQSFEFTVDNARILDLLTGHTLYNESSVVLRELAQNALDAVRLQHHMDLRKNSAAEPGQVQIRWNSVDRVMEVQDNGTGMTQKIIEDNLLRVGASRYEDPKFREEYPDFAAISRFGIGILSTFMIADDVDAITCHPDDKDGRWLTLRSLHGKYLIRLLAKENDPMARQVGPHGTLIRVKLRASAKPLDVLESVRKWVVIPEANVTVQIDNHDPVPVGFTSPREALLATMKDAGVPLESLISAGFAEGRIEVREKEVDGVTTAFAVKWSEYFHDWLFVARGDWERRESSLQLGTCVQGIRVESESPGFDKGGIIALANASGKNAPKTNVARSGLGSLEEQERIARLAYRAYCGHLADEVHEMVATRGVSLSWAVREVNYLISSLTASSDARLRSKVAFGHVLKEVPGVLVERQGRREAISPVDLAQEAHSWTVDCSLFRFAEALLGEIETGASLSQLVGALMPDSDVFPGDPLVCRFFNDRFLSQSVLEDWEVDTVRIHRTHRRVDMRWVKRGDTARWLCRVANPYRLDNLEAAIWQASRLPVDRPILIGAAGVTVEGGGDEIGVRSFGRLYIFFDTEEGKFLRRWFQASEDALAPEDRKVADFVLAICVQLGSVFRGVQGPTLDRLRFLAAQNGLKVPDSLFEERSGVVCAISTNVFDPSAWRREEES